MLEAGQAVAYLGLFFLLFRFLALLLEQQEMPGDIEQRQTVRCHSGKDCLSLLLLCLLFPLPVFGTAFMLKMAFLGKLTALGLIFVPFLGANMADRFRLWWGNNRETETFFKLPKSLAQPAQSESSVHAGCLDRSFSNIDDRS